MALLLTKCAGCDAELGTGGKKCGRCGTRYCGSACQVQHWKEGGHDMLCKKIKKSGGAERFHADEKYDEAVKVAVEKCAKDGPRSTKGQTCYICTEGIKRRTGEGLVSGFCACRGTVGTVHISCLVRQAQVAAEGDVGIQANWPRWYTCGLCHNEIVGNVRWALGWACWKTYVGRLENHTSEVKVMNILAGGLFEGNRSAEAVVVLEAQLAAELRTLNRPANILAIRSNLANCYTKLDRLEEALPIYHAVYEAKGDLLAAMNYIQALVQTNQFAAARAVGRKELPAIRKLGLDHDLALNFRRNYAGALYGDDDATLDEQREGLAMIQDVATRWARVFGADSYNAGQLAEEVSEAKSICSFRGMDIST